MCSVRGRFVTKLRLFHGWSNGQLKRARTVSGREAPRLCFTSTQ
jgi:hypothetical protein